MAYGVIFRVSAPIEAYDAVHAEVMRTASDASTTGLIAHIARATEDGFEIIEIWDAKEQSDAFERDVVGPAMEKVGQGADGPEPELIEFEPRVILTSGERYVGPGSSGQ
jgi:hypothetical protein